MIKVIDSITYLPTRSKDPKYAMNAMHNSAHKQLFDQFKKNILAIETDETDVIVYISGKAGNLKHFEFKITGASDELNQKIASIFQI